MDYRQPLIALLLFVSGSASAAYAHLVPPSTWTPIPPPGMGTITTGNFYSAPANSPWSGALSRTTATMNVVGRQIAVPVSMKLAPSAGRVAAAVLFLSPQLRLASSVASWLTISGVVWDAANKQWSKSASDAVPSTGFDYYISPNYMFSNPTAACQHWISFSYPEVTVVSQTVTQSSCSFRVTQPGWDLYDINLGVQKTPSSCPAGWFVTSAGCVQNAPPATVLTQKEMVDLLNPGNNPGWPSPTVPNEFPPHTPFPVELPIINPDTGVNPFPKPLFIPTGDPIRNPSYNPDTAPGPGNQPWKQPGLTITPRPTANEPWRVDVHPTDREQSGSEPNPDSEYNPDTDPNDKPKPEDKQSICELHPEILACQVIKDSGEKVELQTKEIDFSFTPEAGFSGSATCPPPININASGMALSFSWQPFCNSLSYAKPIILAFAWMSAAFILIGSKEH